MSSHRSPRLSIRLRAVCLALLSLFTVATRASDGRPNVVFLLADDLGWSDTTLYGTTKYYQMPNLERLAKSGMLFTRAYSSSPLCSPTRSSILTGQHPARTGITTPNCHRPQVVLKATPGEKYAPSHQAARNLSPSAGSRCGRIFSPPPPPSSASSFWSLHESD